MRILPFTKTYEERKVLDFPGIVLERGKIYGVIGSNGSGKSTFAKVAAAIVAADGGKRVIEKCSVGYMPQKNYAFRMSTKRNILLGGRDESRAEELMEAMQISHLSDKRADRLSGGETARMALARVMMKKFDLLILDEPTAAMDMETSLLAEKLILRYVEESGCALLLVTHSLQQARRTADEVLFFRKGELVEKGKTQTVLHTPLREETRDFLDFYGI